MEYSCSSAEAIKVWKDAHAACPMCGNTSIMQTLAGSIWHAGKPYRDDINRAECGCGWLGMVNQLVPDVRMPEVKHYHAENNMDWDGNIIHNDIPKWGDNGDADNSQF